MKNLKVITSLFIVITFSLLLINSCEVFSPNYEEFELYGTWNIEDVNIDMDVSGDNFLQVLAARLLIASFKGKLDDELQNSIDSTGGSITFNDDNTYHLGLFEENDTGTWFFDEEENSISLTAEETSIDYLNIEKLNDDQLILSWISEEGEFEDDSTNESFTAKVTIEAVFRKELK